LEAEVKELKRANENLLAASSFFARELDPRLPRWFSSSMIIVTGRRSCPNARSITDAPALASLGYARRFIVVLD
jgi:hypothetical protein